MQFALAALYLTSSLYAVMDLINNNDDDIEAFVGAVALAFILDLDNAACDRLWFWLQNAETSDGYVQALSLSLSLSLSVCLSISLSLSLSLSFSLSLSLSPSLRLSVSLCLGCKAVGGSTANIAWPTLLASTMQNVARA